MCRLARAEFNVGVSAPAEARHWISDLLHRWELVHLSDLAVLLTSEVVTNAVRHSGGGPKLTAGVADGMLEIGVMDADREHPPVLSDSLDSAAEGGRGLTIVEDLSEGWGTNLLPEGKEVWFLLDTGDWPHRSRCVCVGEDLNQLMLDSGRRFSTNLEPLDDFDFLAV
jgi:anti-sigma regulatory factor (Ser/Thr protein kinase)